MQRTSLRRTAPAATIFALLMLPVSFPRVQAQTQTVLYNFCSVGGAACEDGENPNGPLAVDAYGNFYSTTTGGGPSCSVGNCNGTVFELFPEPAEGCEAGTNAGNGWCEIVLYDFCSIANCADGSEPVGNVAYLNAHSGRPGNLYGTTLGGGANSQGIVFELSSKPILSGCPSGTNAGNGWCETVLYNFCSLSNCADGFGPYGNLVEDSAGNLYGTVQNGVFELSPDGSGAWTEALIYQDKDVGEGVAIDAAGNLYGVDAYGVNTGGGVGGVFKLSFSQDGWVAENIHSFSGLPDGSNPNGPPTIDSVGNVYGTTGLGGSKNYGTVWKLSPVTKGKDAGTYKEKILRSFTAEKTGEQGGGLTLDSSGNIYGTTAFGGGTECEGGCGTVFKLAVSGTTYKYELLWSFNGTDGAQPYSNPFLNSSGNLYAVTWLGGANDGGTVFELTP
jgi:uncharacterized repeat protein (TIGR03803 family)